MGPGKIKFMSKIVNIFYTFWKNIPYSFAFCINKNRFLFLFVLNKRNDNEN